MLLVCRKAIDFCRSVLYLDSLLNLLVISSSFWVDVLESLVFSANKDSFISYFSISPPLISLFCLIDKTTFSRTMLKRVGESRYFCLNSGFRWIAPSFTPFSTMLIVIFSFVVLVWLMQVSSSTVFSRSYHEVILDLSKNFSASIEMINRFCCTYSCWFWASLCYLIHLLTCIYWSNSFISGIKQIGHSGEF